MKRKIKGTRMHWREINKTIGNIDIYLLDFILKGFLKEDSKILDVGCGEGRNIEYLLKNNYDVYGIDIDPLAINYLHLLAKSLKINNYDARFQRMNGQKLLFPDRTFDVLISSAVLHFSKNHTEFQKQWKEMLRVLKPGGTLFVRSMTSHFKNSVQNDEGVCVFPNGEERYLINDEMLNSFIKTDRVEWVEPFKYVHVKDARAMGVIILRKK